MSAAVLVILVFSVYGRQPSRILIRTEFYPDAPDSEVTVEFKRHTGFGSCACDVSSQCDVGCCCDPDCPDAVKGSFSFCLPETGAAAEDVKYLWARRNCSELNETTYEDSHGGPIIDWLMRTMLCIHKVNSPWEGDFYEVNEAGNVSSFSDPDSSSFWSAFQGTEQDISSTGFPIFLQDGTPVKVLIGDSHGQCKVVENLSYYDIPYLGRCSVVGDLTGVYGGGTVNLTVMAGQFYWLLEGDVITPGESYAPGFDVLVSSDAPDRATPRGYRPGEFIEFERDFTLEVLTSNVHANERVCGRAGLDIRFGDHLDVPCRMSVGIMTDFLHTDVPAIRIAPGSDETVPVNLVNGSDFSILQSLAPQTSYFIVQEYLFFFKVIGTKKNQHYVIDRVDHRWSYSNLTYNIGIVPILPAPTPQSNSQKGTIDLITQVRFYEVPNELNTELDHAVDRGVQAWLPF